MTALPLPISDPVYPAIVGVLRRRAGEPLIGDTVDGMVHDMLGVVAEDRVRQALADLDPSGLTGETPPVATDLRLQLGEDVDDAEPLDTITVTSDTTPLGVYVCVIGYSDDVTRTLTPAEVGSYTHALGTMIAQAEYDAAVVNQLTNIKRPKNDSDRQHVRDAAFQIVLALRANRAAVDQKLVKPLIVRPSVGYRTGMPFLDCRVAGTQRRWQWSPAAVSHHIDAVRNVSVVADLDALYRRVLVSTVDLDDETARKVVADLGLWRLPREPYGA